jgi:hypothetical protein
MNLISFKLMPFPSETEKNFRAAMASMPANCHAVGCFSYQNTAYIMAQECETITGTIETKKKRGVKDNG